MNKYGHVPLNYVIRRDDQPDPNVNLGIVKLLLEAGAQPDACMDGNTTADEGGLTCLTQAAFNDHTQRVSSLLKYGADPAYPLKAFENQNIQLSPNMQWLLKCSISWRPKHHCLFPPAFRFGVVYLRKALKRNQTVFAGFNEDILVLIFTFLPRDWGLE